RRGKEELAHISPHYTFKTTSGKRQRPYRDEGQLCSRNNQHLPHQLIFTLVL
ncbi:mCG145159, partial [Mus musculus]